MLQNQIHPALRRYHEKAAQARELLAQIPEDAAVRSSTFFVPQLSMRDEIYLLDSGHEAGYAVVDLRANYEKNLEQTLEQLEKDGYEEAGRVDRYVAVFEKTAR